MWGAEPAAFLTIAKFMAAAACATLALGHLFVWVQRAEKTAHLWFAISAMAAGANPVAEAFLYRAPTVADYNVGFKWANSLSALAFVSLLWFFTSYAETGGRWRGLRVGITAVFVFAAVMNLVLPYGFLFADMTSLKRFVLPWGEVIALAEGPASSWRYLSDLAFVGMLVVGVGETRAMWRQGRNRGAVFVGGSFLLYLFVLLVSGYATDVGLVELP